MSAAGDPDLTLRSPGGTGSTGAAPAGEPDAVQLGRARRFIGWLLIATVAATVLEFAFYLGAPDVRTGAATIMLAVLAAWLGAARVVLRRGVVTIAVAMACAGLLVAIPIAALVIRNEAGLAVAPLIAVAAALPYLRRRALVIVSLLAVLVGVVAAVVQQLLPPPTTPPSPLTIAFRAGVVATALGLVLFLLWQFSSRLRDTVSERERSEDALRSTAETLRSLVESSPLAISVLDRHGDVVLINPAAEQMFGWRSDEVIGRPPPQIPPDEQPALRESLARVLRGESFTALEARRQRRDGTMLHASVSMGPVRRNGRVDGAVILVADISERKRLEAQLLQAQRMESVGRLAGGIAHDFNNLLTVITGHADLLLHEVPADDPNRDELEAIHQAARRAAALTAQLLAFSRGQNLQPEVIALNDVVRKVEPMLRRLIGEDIAFSTALPDDVGSAKVDRGQLEQVIVNLVLNARDAMPNGGKLLVETANAEPGSAISGLAGPVAPGRYVVLAVTDTGVGMDRETQARLFEPFYTTKEPGKGTGLGLATTYGIVKQSGGHITVYSEEGRGSAFTIYFPRADTDPASVKRDETPAVAARGTETVLVVEDDAAVRRLSGWALERQGYRVLTAASGVDALAVASGESRLDLLLTDVVMPGLTGRELADRMKRLHPGLKVLYMSGYTDEAIVRHGVLEPGVDFINKPFAATVLSQKVREVLGVGDVSSASANR